MDFYNRVMTPNAAYAELLARSKDLAVLNSCAAVLGWDQQTYMPKRGAGLRGEQMAWLAGDGHKKATDPKIGELLAAVEGTIVRRRCRFARGGERPRMAAWLRPGHQAAVATGGGTGPRHDGGPAGVGGGQEQTDFALFRPQLEKVVALKREEADAVGFRGPCVRRACSTSTNRARRPRR